MKKNNLRLFLAAIMLIGLTTLQSCSKEGPAGPAGVGNLQSKQVTINPSDWQWNSSQLSYYVDHKHPKVFRKQQNIPVKA